MNTIKEVKDEQNKLYVLLKHLNIPPKEFKVTFECYRHEIIFLANQENLTKEQVDKI